MIGRRTHTAIVCLFAIGAAMLLVRQARTGVWAGVVVLGILAAGTLAIMVRDLRRSNERDAALTKPRAEQVRRRTAPEVRE